MKTNIVLLGTIIAATIGLISCSPDVERKTDQLKMREPIITKSDGSIPWNDFMLREGKELDISDKIKFSDANDVLLEVKSSCLKNQRKWSAQRTLKLGHETSVADLVSDEVLSAVTEATPLNCSFSFVARNSKGSKQVFELQSVHLVDKIHDTTIKVTSTENGSVVTEARVDDPSVIFDFGSEKADRLKLNCNRSSVETTNISSALRLSDLPDSAMLRTPVQRCRAIVYVGDRRLGFSNSFIFILGKPDLNIEIKDSDFYSDSERGKKGFLMPNLSIKVENAELGKNVQILILKNAPIFKVQLLSALNRSSSDPTKNFATSKVLEEQGTVKLSETDGSIIAESEASTLVDLKPSQKLTFDLMAKYTGKCKGAIYLAWSEEKYSLYVRENIDGEFFDLLYGTFNLGKKLHGPGWHLSQGNSVQAGAVICPN